MGLLNGLLAYYKLDGNSNDAKGSNDGTDTGVTYSAGKINSGAVFTGTNPATSYILIPQQQLSSNAGSLSFWVRRSGAVPSGVFLGDSLDNCIFFIFDATTIIIRGTNIANKSYTVPALAANTWYHFVVTMSGGAMRLYVNGTESSTGAQAMTQTIGIGQLGRNSTGSSGFNALGTMDEVGLWNKALTPGEISELYNSGNGLSFDAFTFTNTSNFLPFFYQ